jgi:hypothetical protein
MLIANDTTLRRASISIACYAVVNNVAKIEFCSTQLELMSIMRKTLITQLDRHENNGTKNIFWNSFDCSDNNSAGFCESGKGCRQNRFPLAH